MGNEPVFVGREPELDVLHRAWRSVRDSQARVVCVAGDPGVGKTALVRRFVEEAGPEHRIWVSGDEAEAGLHWGVLAQLARVLPGSWAARADPVFAGQALARELQDSKELILVVDDAQWADRPSLAALRLAARRLLADPVLLVVVQQTPGELDRVVRDREVPDLDDGWRRLLDSERGARIRLSGLTAADLVRLGGLSPGGAARLHEHTGGHPLHALHLLDELPAHTINYGHGPLPAPRGVATAIRSRLAACSPATRDLLAAAAVLGTPVTRAALRELDGHDAAEAVRMRLLDEVPGTAGQELIFPGTLVRSVIYHDLEPERRRELHRKAAARGGPGALWHGVAAADGPDERLAADAEAAGREQLGHGWIPLAAAHLRHAADLTPPGPDRRSRLLTAVEAMLVAGDLAPTLPYQGELGGTRWGDYVLGYQLLLTGRVTEATTLLRRALDAASEPGEPADLDARIATQLTIIGVLTVAYPDMIRYGATAVAAAREPWVAAFAWFARALGLAVAGRAEEALTELAGADAPGAPAGLDGLVARGMLRLWSDDLPGARRDLAAVVRRAAQGEPLRVGQALGFLGETEYRQGALGEAVLHAELAVQDATGNGRVWDYPMVHAIACYPLAAQGAWERAEAHAEQAGRWARAVATPSALVYAAAARAALAQARDDPAWLLAAATEAAAHYPAAEAGTHLLGPLRAEALARLGRPGEAAQALAEFPPTGRRSVQMCAARARAQLAVASGRPRDALAEYRTALQLARETGLRLEAARIELLTAECLLGMGRRAAAERSLRSALRQCTAMGATAYADRVLDLAARAGLALDAPPAALGALTAAERAVVTLAGSGSSNREIAARLVLSVKTVEYHLTNVFRKLDIATREELRQALNA
ncbi:AAA family ATPase [Acrocarpospora catenulata]|uniref:AAA family ATPase n=1 Tax=Acrocarpospora catenulata TaxID=2836182 RepID=UPI001BDA89DB|nr:AAA family ATPase [Acrocarpospora catenulata]